jgi:hypothetical protein
MNHHGEGPNENYKIYRMKASLSFDREAIG